ncbi:MAG: hypothetical protein OXP09_14060 [Gammaproteobacteria bacterium]|nr:hypothetical protein [Gammaproteobacteria bacterium]
MIGLFEDESRSDPPSGSHFASTLDGFRRFAQRLVILTVGFALFASIPSHAGQADVNVPMRRDIGATTIDRAGAAPDDVVTVTELVRQEIEMLRRELGVKDFPPRAESHDSRRPIHIYVKALEVMSKVAAVQRRLGVPESSVPGMPLAGLSSDDVLLVLQDIVGGIRAIKTQMVIESGVDTGTLSTPRTLSAAYKNLADSSAMLDGLVGRGLTTEQVFQGVRSIAEDLNLVAAELQVALEANAPVVADVRESADIAQQALRAAYKVVLLQSRLGLEPSAVPTLTLVRVTPAEAYDLIGILRAELARIKWHLGIDMPAPEIVELSQARNLVDVFAQMLLVVRNLDLLAAGIET